MKRRSRAGRIGSGLTQVVERGGDWRVLTGLVASSGGGIRTPDTRIMIPRPEIRNSLEGKENGRTTSELAASLPCVLLEACNPPDFGPVVRHRSKLAREDREYLLSILDKLDADLE